jgi:putative NIF3 family GTP cyclohydrolase 1 type 2
LDLSLAGDRAGFTGPGDPYDIEVNNVLVLMDYLQQKEQGRIDYDNYDLVILHHPPEIVPELPAYVIHTGWDRLPGGACEALADCLNIVTDDVLDEKTGLGRVGRIRNGPVPLARFAWEVMGKLKVRDLRMVNNRPGLMVERVGLVPGFGLNPAFIKKAGERKVDLYISGDLTHPGAILAKNMDIVLMDATHYATELPGLLRLGEQLARIGPKVRVLDTNVPWSVSSMKNGF